MIVRQWDQICAEVVAPEGFAKDRGRGLGVGAVEDEQVVAVPRGHDVAVDLELADLGHVRLGEAGHFAGRLHAKVLVYLVEVDSLASAQAEIVSSRADHL